MKSDDIKILKDEEAVMLAGWLWDTEIVNPKVWRECDEGIPIILVQDMDESPPRDTVEFDCALNVNSERGHLSGMQLVYRFLNKKIDDNACPVCNGHGYTEHLVDQKIGNNCRVCDGRGWISLDKDDIKWKYHPGSVDMDWFSFKHFDFSGVCTRSKYPTNKKVVVNLNYKGKFVVSYTGSNLSDATFFVITTVKRLLKKIHHETS